MMTVHEVSSFSGVSVRTLQYYDRIGLLPAPFRTQAGYRLYDEASLEVLQQILLFRELEFPLKDIRKILKSPDYDRDRALEQQIALLTLKKEHIEKLICLAGKIRNREEKELTFEAFDTGKIDDYTARAKASWGGTRAYKEYEKKSAGRNKEESADINRRMMNIFARFGDVKNEDPKEETAQALVKELQDYITEHFYTCTDEILLGLGKMYAAGGEFTENIDRFGGEGTAAFACSAIQFKCGH